MSKKIVEEIILKAKADANFMQQLLRDPDTTLKDYKLTKAEREFFHTIDEKTIQGLSSACFQLADKAMKK